GLVVGGKTGTARTANKGKYTDIYNSSFFGFAKDKKNTLVVGVVVCGSLGSEEYYGSQTAAPIFKQIIQTLVKYQYLTPSKDLIKETPHRTPALTPTHPKPPKHRPALINVKQK
uniref:penicillin-binding transpeptidase domain-containing protein n=1 Tax=Helicobacter bizzozeronii TaxID=56877 RepID=UPI0022770DCD